MSVISVDSVFPEMDASSAVSPTARVAGRDLYLAYHLAPGCEDCAVVLFENVSTWRYGYPNDEGLAEHPLWGKGLTFYNFHILPSSSGTGRTWIATFHEGTLEVSAERARVCVERHRDGRPWEALEALLGEGENRMLDDDDA